MDNEQVVDIVEKKVPVKWLDGLFYSNQSDMDDEKLGEDLLVLQKQFFTKPETVTELAAQVGVKPNNKRFQDSIRRLSVKQCITVRSHKWDGVSGSGWLEVDDPKVTITSKGEFLAASYKR